MSVAECANCGFAAPPESRFCPECGRPLPLAEKPSRRRFRVEPFLVLVAVAVVAGLVLLARGTWAWGIAAVLLAGILLLGRREVERRRAARAVASLRARAAAAGEAVAARSREQVELFRARRELAELDAQRARAFHQLGRATFYEDEADAASARSAITAVLGRIRDKEAEIARLKEETEQRLERAQLQAQPTEHLEMASETADEPSPAPDEPTRLRRSG